MCILLLKVLEQALSWTEDDQEFKISVLLNLASLAKQLCISSEKWETFGYNTCDPEYTCTPDSIIENFLPSLVQGIQVSCHPRCCCSSVIRSNWAS